MKIIIDGIEMNSIFGHEKYFVDELGEHVYSLKRKKGRFLKISVDKDGYKIVGQIDGVFTPGIHRLVWLAWRGAIPKGYQIDHIDHCPLNCNLSNLRMLSRKEHMKHHFDSEITKTRMSNSRKGHLVSQQTKQKISNALKGKCSHPRTPQMIKKFLKTMQKKKKNENKEKIEV